MPEDTISSGDWNLDAAISRGMIKDLNTCHKCGALLVQDPEYRKFHELTCKGRKAENEAGEGQFVSRKILDGDTLRGYIMEVKA